MMHVSSIHGIEREWFAAEGDHGTYVYLCECGNRIALRWWIAKNGKLGTESAAIPRECISVKELVALLDDHVDAHRCMQRTE